MDDEIQGPRELVDSFVERSGYPHSFTEGDLIGVAKEAYKLGYTDGEADGYDAGYDGGYSDGFSDGEESASEA